MTTRNRLLRAKRFAVSAAALLIAAGVTAARAEDAAAVDHSKMDHSQMDHSAHGGAAPAQWVDPGKAASAAEAAKPDEHAGHHGGGDAPGGGMMGGMNHGGAGGGMGMMGGMDHGGGGAGGTEHGGGMGGMMQHMLCGFTEHLEGRLAYLKAELKLTDTQASAWSAFADAWRGAAQKATAACAGLDGAMDHSQPPVLHKLGMMEKHMSIHLDIIRAQKAAIEPLFTALSDEQRKIASETLTSVLKVGMQMGGGMSHGGGMGGMMGGMSHGASGGAGAGAGGMQH